MKKKCHPQDIAIKSFFLGPQAENGAWLQEQIKKNLGEYLSWRQHLFKKDGRAISAVDQKSRPYVRTRKRLESAARQLTKMLQSETPTFSPRYIGHMVSESSLPAILGHIITLLHNPNNVSKEVAKVGLRIEAEAISALAEMIGYDSKTARGHFTSGGTVANFEGLWRARYRLDHFFAMALARRLKLNDSRSLFELCHMGWSEFHKSEAAIEMTESEMRENSFVANSPWTASEKVRHLFGHSFLGPVVLVPGNKHYSWQKGVSLLGLGESAFWPILLDEAGRLSLKDLAEKISLARRENRPVLCVVSVAGTTEMGEVDPVDEVQDLLDQLKTKEGLHIWHHVDAAYGGFFCSLVHGKSRSHHLDERTHSALRAIRRSDSVTLDPHKLGYVPYACGAFISSDAANYRVSTFAAPYLSQSNEQPAGWASTIEGSRSAAGAAATWLSNRTIGFNASGLGRILEKGLIARSRMLTALLSIPDLYIIQPADTNILCFVIARQGEPLSVTNERTLKLYQDISDGPLFGVSKTSLSHSSYSLLIDRFIHGWSGQNDAKAMILLRVVLMNPFLISKEIKADFTSDFGALIERLAKKFS